MTINRREIEAHRARVEERCRPVPLGELVRLYVWTGLLVVGAVWIADQVVHPAYGERAAVWFLALCCLVVAVVADRLAGGR